MPALLCSTPLAESLAHATLSTDTICRKQQQQRHTFGSYSRTPFDIPEICDQIAAHLDRRTLTVVVRVSSQWYTHWIRHLWRRVRVDSSSTGTATAVKSRDMLQAFPHLSQHIRHLEWIHLSPSSNASCPQQDPTSILETIDLSNLNAETILLSSWTNGLDAATLSKFTQSSAHRLSALQMYNMAQVRGDLLKVAGTIPGLRHFTLSMAHRDCHRNQHNRHRSNALTASSSVGSLTATSALPSGSEKAELVEVTSANSLPDLMDACPQLRMIEILDLPLPTSPAASLSAAVSVFEDQDSDNEENEEENQEQEQNIDEMLLEKVTPTWLLMHHLTTINLHATAISGSTLTALFARSPQLIKLNLGQNTPLYLSDFQVDPSLCMSKLSTLILSGCHFLDGHGYKEIFKASPNLLHLDIPQTNVDDAALAVLGHQCLELTDLNLDECLQITDQGIRDMLSHPRPTSPSSSINHHNTLSDEESGSQERYENRRLQCLSVSNCTELTGQGIHHILMTCGRLRSLEFQQPEIMPESLFPHTLETDEDAQQLEENPSAPSATNAQEQEQESATTDVAATVYPSPNAAADITSTLTAPAPATTTTVSVAWACQGSLEQLRIKNLNVINPDQTRFLNERLRELPHLKALHIGGSQLELSVLNGLGHQLENLYIDDLAREVDMDDVRWLVDHTPNLTRLWCRQLIRHSEPWKMLKSARKHLKLW
ncbi:hypothetical protein BGZ96_003511 [Linnemannia gamsii]|uniref:F-box/LRR-repeat protein 15-like leucin rich repeat domain-containing protein n=1 Tax=Linnemannia gamsii TaxID=64522 RepID=A0ABQ7K6T4_9FUNG|nr:hypothetical protein BGZ96_003511 [Linnemannia gamsii]